MPMRDTSSWRPSSFSVSRKWAKSESAMRICSFSFGMPSASRSASSVKRRSGSGVTSQPPPSEKATALPASTPSAAAVAASAALPRSSSLVSLSMVIEESITALARRYFSLGNRPARMIAPWIV